ncbi:HEAT repeat domain-containing protein [Streptomyces beijiangensis]|uniref:HEAT repeat domain-containing protein n=1 Tax=Streptomyces beijiangensis TaxID=163361 RepID=A0A939JIT6_9ACTN|nr:HEAT repeat domain-containing protein [Streptomyces beijiangensis]MBO0512914.1 HEAT repeat domain-containing protein [Streptomyces beijiangensis]
MTTPVDEAFESAAGRADVAWLAARVDAQMCAPAVLGRLVRHEDPRVRHLGIVLLGERVDSVTEEPQLAELAALLPDSPEGTPEASLLLAALYERLWYSRQWPDRRAVDRLPARVRIAWLRAELVNQPESLRAEPAGELLYQAVREMSIARTPRPGPLVAGLVDSGDAVLEGAGLRLAREGLHAGVLAPSFVREQLVRLLGSVGAEVVGGALRELGEPWAALEPLPVGVFSRFLDAGATGDAALTAAARHGHRGLLRHVVESAEQPPGLRRRAMELLGELAERDEIGALIGIAGTDPLLLGGPLVRCLRGLHRRGHFAGSGEVAGVVELALADHSVPAREVATVLFTCREELLRVLLDVPVDDPGWPRRLDLLVALEAQGTHGLPVGEAITRLLPLVVSPGPFLCAIRELRYAAAEDAVLALLPSVPSAALGALEAVGGERTVAVLRDGLGLGPGLGLVAPYFRAVRDRALELLWHLTRDPADRRDLLARLDPVGLPARIASGLGGPDEVELALLSSHLDAGEPVASLCRLAAHGGAATLPVLADLLLRVVAELAVTEDSGSEPAVSQEVLDALRALGLRLHERGRIRPVCLLDAVDGREAGDALVASMVLDLLDRSGLSADEQSILLELLLRAPSARIRPRVHRLLRHRDPQVRKHVIRLLAADASGDGAEALSATLIPLTAAPDIQTVRQALLALGQVRARWASAAIAACLGHPNMNIKKTAAGALVLAGAPAAVPDLLFWLGRHDNPGFRRSLVDALRAVLGEAYAATLRAAMERSGDERTRRLLSEGLETTRRAPVHGGEDRDIRRLVDGGWNPLLADRIAERPQLPSTKRLQELRPLLAEWLRLAETGPGLRDRVVRLVLRLCPAPWTDGELAAFARSVRVLLDALAGAAPGGEVRDGREVREVRDGIVAVLEEVAPVLSVVERAVVADAVRAGGALSLTLLRRCGAVLVRADLDRALAVARRGADPWPAEAAVLRDAFDIRPTEAKAEAEAPRSREQLAALAGEYSAAGPEARTDLLDRMESLQPLDAPPWTIAETANTPADAPRAVRNDGLDQPRSAAQRQRLLAMLDAPAQESRTTAAVALLKWPERAAALPVLRACLHGRVDVPEFPGLPCMLVALDETELRAPGVLHDRAVRMLWHLPAEQLGSLVPLLLDWWQQDPPAVRSDIGRVLRSCVPADTLAVALRERLDAGGWGFLDLLAGSPLLRTPELTETVRRLRAEGHDDLADGLRLVDGPLRGPDAVREDAAALSALRERTPARTPEPLTRQGLYAAARTGSPEQIRRALTRLTEERQGPGPELPLLPALPLLLRELLTHPRPGVRLHAHRTARALLDREAYLELTSLLLDDPQPDVVRLAVRTVSHAGWEPAVPALTALLEHPHPVVRKAAAEGLLRMGAPAVPALRHAAARARPDKRSLYTGLLDELLPPGP